MKVNSSSVKLMAMASRSVFLLLLAGFLGLALTANRAAFAQDFAPGHLEAAKRAIATTSATAKLNDILPAAAGRLIDQLIASRPDIEAEISNLVNESALELAPRRGDLEKEAAKIYARIFNEAELTQIDAFFATDTGQKFLTELPIVVREVDKAARIWGTGINRDLAQNVREKLKAAKLD